MARSSVFKGALKSKDKIVDISLYKHQWALLELVRTRPDIPYYLLLGGYGCGKTFTDVLLILYIYSRYNGEYVTVLICGVNQTLLRKTLLADLERTLVKSGVPYTHNKADHTIWIGTIQYIYIGVEDPNTVYAYNASITLIDELDELKLELVLEVLKASQERTRIMLPDRSPYTVITTTFQGIRGMAQIITNFDLTGTKYASVRGMTKDNTSLSPEYITRLYQLYTEDEAKVFLEGYMLNINTGRVYGEYDDTKHVYARFKLRYNEKVYCGQDFNAGFNKCVTGVVRNGIIFIAMSYSWANPGDAPRALRNIYKTNELLMVPDASAKEIMEGYKAEVSEADIQLAWFITNPSVTERILVVNKLLRLGLLFIMGPSEDGQWADDLSQALKARVYDDNGKPEKGKGPKALDHICDALEYLIWYIVHHDSAFETLLDMLRMTTMKMTRGKMVEDTETERENFNETNESFIRYLRGDV